MASKSVEPRARLKRIVEATFEVTPISARPTSDGRADVVPVRASITPTTPPKPSARPNDLRQVSGSFNSRGATSARISGLVLATIEPMPDASPRESAVYVNPRYAAFARTPRAAYTSHCDRRPGNGRPSKTATTPMTSPATRKRATRNHSGGTAVAPILLGTYAEAQRMT